jgi:hypothetical protein
MHSGPQALRSGAPLIGVHWGEPSATMKWHTIARHDPTEAEIQHAAYLLWVEDGRPEGRDLEHWLAAKELLTHRHGRDASTGHRAAELPLSLPLRETLR